MAPIAESNLILFPKTIDYYQIELTRMLETERYREAIGALRFLLQCRHEDESTRKEWGSLLDWLETTFPDAAADAGTPGSGSAEGWGESQGTAEEDEVTEEDLIRRRVWLKSAEDSQYVPKLLETLVQTDAPDKQLLALEQLRHAEFSRTNRTIREWLETSRVHPVVQFRALQVLRGRGEAGSLKLHKLGQQLTLDIAETPMSYDDFPPQIGQIRERVKEVNEVNHPTLAYFVEQMWNDFLAFIYGTSIYREMLGMDSGALNIWAAALHHSLQETMFASADERDTRELFGLADEQIKAWQKASQVMKLFLTVTAPAEP
ncbi:hypothetical protein [Paenibacillus sp. HJGM_3]|uniref:hypothetical protein n=1 Tax=Paenibacillus sp. HJGM_3 TaxID=3379816 RepID=UPI00385CE295